MLKTYTWNNNKRRHITGINSWCKSILECYFYWTHFALCMFWKNQSEKFIIKRQSVSKDQLWLFSLLKSSFVGWALLISQICLLWYQYNKIIHKMLKIIDLNKEKKAVFCTSYKYIVARPCNENDSSIIYRIISLLQ